jgi:hypothetical protein
LSLLSICQQAANSLALVAPASIIGNSDETAMRLLAAAQDEGENLARRPEDGWVSMMTEYDFVTSATPPQNGTITNSGPNGVAVISGLTLSNVSVNPVAPFTWYAYGSWVPQQAIVQAVTFADPHSTVTLNAAAIQTGAGSQYVFGQSDYPLPATFQRVIDNTLWDRSRFWSMRGPQSPQQWQLYKSSVIGRASIQRRFRFREINGNSVFSIDPVPTDNNSALVFEYVSNGWCKSSAGVPQNTWEADTDVGILDEYLIRLGVKWRMKLGLGFAFQNELDEYDHEVSKAVAKDGGMAILDMTPNNQLSLIGPWNISETGFGGQPV